MPADAFVRLARQRFPKLPVVAVVHLTSADFRGLLQVAPVGISAVFAIGVDSPSQVLQSVVASPAVDASVEAVLSALRPRVCDAAWPFVTFAVSTASAPTTVEDWSASVGIQRTTLLRRLHGAGLPPPTTVLTLGCLLVAAQLIGVHRWTVTQTASSLHYSSASALRKSLRLHIGVCPHETRSAGGMDRVMNAVGAILQLPGADERPA